MKEVFIPKDKKPQPGISVGLILGNKATKGEVGIEIEVEGKRLPHDDETPPPWVYHSDGSLRGEDNGEYVLRKPLSFEAIPNALQELWSVFKAKKSSFDDSNRTSVHVHVNCQDWHLNRLASFLGLYYTLEEILTEWCGEHRVGNLFCLRGIDAPGTVTAFKRFIQTDGEYRLNDALHYAAMNPNALKKYGSLEIRTLRGCSDPGIIEKWVSIIERLYHLSAEFHDPREVCTMLSGMGAMAWFNTVLGGKADVIRSGLAFTDSDIEASLRTGIRLAQDLCYCRDWSMYDPIQLKADPFNRPLKKIVKKMTNTEPLFAHEYSYGDAVTFTGTINTNTSPPTVNEGWESDDQDDYPDPDDLEY